MPGVYEALADVRRWMRLFANFSERASRGAGLSTLEYQGLLAIKALSSRGATRHSLRRELDLRWRESEALTKRLEQSRLIRIEADLNDRRFKRLHLTARGEGVLEQLAAKHLVAIRIGCPNVIGSLCALSDARDRADDMSAAQRPSV